MATDPPIYENVFCQTCGLARPCGNFCSGEPAKPLPSREDLLKAATALKEAAADRKRPLLVRAVASVFGMLAEDLATPEDAAAEKHRAEDRPTNTDGKSDP